MSETGCTEARQEKHVGLQEAINSLDSLVEQADRLLGKIHGTPPQISTAPDQIEAVLINVLDGGADQIHKFRERLQQMLSEIDVALF